MIPDWLQSLLDWLTANPHWAGAAVFLVAMLESMFVIGVLVPGAIAMFGFGALIAVGTLDPWATYGWAVAGAVTGDGISFWIGYHFKDHLRQMWPLKNRPELLERGERFFRTHGGKSVVLGRFVGPIRAVIPTVAGIAGMSPWRFTLVNVISAIAWAPAYLLPGFILGISLLSLASQMAWRITVVVLGLLAGIWFIYWLFRKLYQFLAPISGNLLTRSLHWGRRIPHYGWIVDSLLDPDRSDAPALSRLALVLLTGFWVFVALSAFQISRAAYSGLDHAVLTLLQQLRFPALDRFMVGVSQLGDVAVIGPLSAAILIYFAARKQWIAAGHWLSAAAFAAVAQWGLKLLFASDRPMEIYSGAAHYAFPSGHAINASVIFGLLAIMLAQGSNTKRWSIYATTAVLIIGIGFSRLYLGAHWLSDVLAGLGLGLAWAALVGIAYRRHTRASTGATALGATGAIVFVAAAAWHIDAHHAAEMARYQPNIPLVRVTTEAWWNERWRDLPTYRLDLQGQNAEPLTLQYAGALNRLAEELRARGWHAPVPFTLGSFVATLKPNATLDEIPFLPRIHERQDAALVLAKVDGDGEWALHLWPTAVRTEQPAPVWVGAVEKQRANTFGYFTIRAVDSDRNAGLDFVTASLQGLNVKSVRRDAIGGSSAYTWDGTVILVTE